MTYDLLYDEEALRFLESTPAKQLRQIISKVDALRSCACPPGSRIIRNADDQGHEVRRLRSGNYRVAYSVWDLEIHVLHIGFRSDFYRRYDR